MALTIREVNLNKFIIKPTRSARGSYEFFNSIEGCSWYFNAQNNALYTRLPGEKKLHWIGHVKVKERKDNRN